jgi:hypothetical protein
VTLAMIMYSLRASIDPRPRLDDIVLILCMNPHVGLELRARVRAPRLKIEVANGFLVCSLELSRGLERAVS